MVQKSEKKFGKILEASSYRKRTHSKIILTNFFNFLIHKTFPSFKQNFAGLINDHTEKIFLNPAMVAEWSKTLIVENTAAKVPSLNTPWDTLFIKNKYKPNSN